MKPLTPYLTALALTATQAMADDPISGAPTIEAPLPELSYRVIALPLADFLEQVARDGGARITISDGVRGRLSQTDYSGTPSAIFDTLAREYALDWFEFNGVYYVSAKSEALTRMTRLGDLTDTVALDALASASLVIPKFPIRRTAESSALAVSGPPTYLALVEALIEAVPQAPVTKTATAYPTIIERRGTEMTVVPIR